MILMILILIVTDFTKRILNSEGKVQNTVICQ